MLTLLKYIYIYIVVSLAFISFSIKVILDFIFVHFGYYILKSSVSLIALTLVYSRKQVIQIIELQVSKILNIKFQKQSSSFPSKSVQVTFNANSDLAIFIF